MTNRQAVKRVSYCATATIPPQWKSNFRMDGKTRILHQELKFSLLAGSPITEELAKSTNHRSVSHRFTANIRLAL